MKPNFPPVKQPRVPLREGETIVIQADDPKYDRGLVVKLTGKGGYDMAYWYDQPDKLYPAEVKIDGKTITKDGLLVHIGYHPQLAQYVSSKSNPKYSPTRLATFAGLGALGGQFIFKKPVLGFILGGVVGLLHPKS